MATIFQSLFFGITTGSGTIFPPSDRKLGLESPETSKAMAVKIDDRYMGCFDLGGDGYRISQRAEAVHSPAHENAGEMTTRRRLPRFRQRRMGLGRFFHIYARRRAMNFLS
jgi:hypothetical protein